LSVHWSTIEGARRPWLEALLTEGREDGRLLAAVLASRACEAATELADERSRGPLAARLVKEGADLGRRPAVTGREAKEKAVERLELAGLDDGQRADGGGTHLGASRLGQELLDLQGVDPEREGLSRKERASEQRGRGGRNLEVLDLGAGRPGALDDGLGERVNVAVPGGSEAQVQQQIFDINEDLAEGGM
jgi:hypothetical protein